MFVVLFCMESSHWRIQAGAFPARAPPPLFEALFFKNVPKICPPFDKTAIHTPQKVSESHGTMVYGSEGTMAPESLGR